MPLRLLNILQPCLVKEERDWDGEQRREKRNKINLKKQWRLWAQTSADSELKRQATPFWPSVLPKYMLKSTLKTLTVASTPLQTM